MKDTIRVLGLKFAAKHGVLPCERNLTQPFEIDVEVMCDLSVPAESDRLEDTINYSQIVSKVQQVVNGGHCYLIEKLAGRIIENVSVLVDEGEIIVRVRKPRAPISIPFDTVEVELRRVIKK